MTAPLRVAVVRPKLTAAEQFARFVILTGFTFLNALVLMLILGATAPWHPGYWTTVLVLYGVRILRGPGTSHLDWTWQPKKSEAAS